MSPRFRHILLLAFTLLAVSGCHSWQPVSRAPTSAVWRDLPDQMRVTLDDGRLLTFERPVIQLDQTIRSANGGSFTPLLNISTVEVRRFNAVRTFGLVLVKASALLQIAALIVDGQPHYRGLF